MSTAMEVAAQRAMMSASLVERLVFGDPDIQIRRSSDGLTKPAKRVDEGMEIHLSASFKVRSSEADIFELLLDGALFRCLPAAGQKPSANIIVEWVIEVGAPVTM